MAEINLVQSLLNKDIESLTKKETCTYKVESLSKKLGQVKPSVPKSAKLSNVNRQIEQIRRL